MSGDKVDIPRSIRLQKKVWEVKDPGKIGRDHCKCPSISFHELSLD